MEGFYPEMREQQKQVGAGMRGSTMKETPMYKSYVAVAPKPEDFPRLLQAMGDLMREPVRLFGGCEEADDADHAGLRRQRHVPA